MSGLLVALALIAGQSPVDETATADDRVLKNAEVGADSTALLEFFR